MSVRSTPRRSVPTASPGSASSSSLVEHLYARDGGLVSGADAHDLDLVARVDRAALDPAGDDGAAALDGEDVLDGHEERAVAGTVRDRNVVVELGDELMDARVLRRGRVRAGRLERAERADAHDGRVVAGEVVLAEEFAHLELDELQEFLVVHHVDLVEGDDDARHLDLAREQDVLAGLRHGAVGRRNHEDGAVHLGRAGDHILDVVGVAGAVHVGVVTVGGLVLHVGDVDGHASRLLFGRAVDRVERAEGPAAAEGEDLGDRGGQGRLAVVDVSDGADVQVRLGSLKLLLSHLALFLRHLLWLVSVCGRWVGSGMALGHWVEPTIGLEPMTSFLPRTCSTV